MEKQELDELIAKINDTFVTREVAAQIMGLSSARFNGLLLTELAHLKSTELFGRQVYINAEVREAAETRRQAREAKFQAKAAVATEKQDAALLRAQEAQAKAEARKIAAEQKLAERLIAAEQRKTAAEARLKAIVEGQAGKKNGPQVEDVSAAGQEKAATQEPIPSLEELLRDNV